ncbi:MAG: hypothetical protein M1827_007673 [Pycnora praestabilis]|nr:MAG: hypothetical protein M1827_007673 [Pycnora praestabilis]
MLKSTHKALPLTADPTPLPLGWTEHTAPTGHAYFYSAVTKQSTYTRPTQSSVHQSSSPVPGNPGFHATQHIYNYGDPNSMKEIYPPHTYNGGFPNTKAFGNPQYQQRGRFQARWGSQGGRDYDQGRRKQPEDRPKSGHTIPGCAPWVLVKTRLGRRFVHNPDNNESFWKFPEEVMKAVVEYDIVQREQKERRARGEDSDVEDETAVAAEEIAAAESYVQPGPSTAISAAISEGNSKSIEEDSDEYEEVEVTDDEDDENLTKRQKTGDEDPGRPVEFDEHDIAYQLAAMGQEYGLDPGEYGDGDGEDWEEGVEGLPLTEEDSTALFKDMLDDSEISPYSTWDKIIEEGKIVNDARYTVMTNMKSRKEVWDDWCREKVQRLKEQRERQERKNVKATPKLYWPEFKRKYKKESEMRESRFSDKEREKLYREHINRLKLPESTLKSELSVLLKSIPLTSLNHATTLSTLPPSFLTDIRYISLTPSTRDPLIEAYISTLPPAPSRIDLSPEDEEEFKRRRTERGKREKALEERERRVKEEKRRQRSALEFRRGMLREGEEEIERAMRVGKEGLRAQLGVHDG